MILESWPDDLRRPKVLTATEPGSDGPESILQSAAALLDYAPAPVAIIQRGSYRVLYANIAFRTLHDMPPVAHNPSVSDVVFPEFAREIEALIDADTVARARARAGMVETAAGDHILKCASWPLAGTETDELAVVVMETRPAADDGPDREFRMALTERLVISALQNQKVAERAEAAARIAEAANEAKAGFLSRMSHELRTPLNAIGGYTELLAMGLRGPVTAAQREDLGRIQRAQAHLLGLINSVLDLSRLEAGNVRFDMTSVALRSTLDAVEEMLMPHVNRQGLSYHALPSDRGGDDLRVSADPEKLRQILLNLLSNAIKFTAPGGMITVSCDVEAKLVSLHIADTGRGIPPDQVSVVFDPFVQVGRRLNSTDQGVGLGLSISRDLARGMGGDLTVMSELDVGSTFTLTLRRVSTDAPPSP